MSNRYTGRVKWFNHKRGFGFIENLDLNEDIFVHQSELKPNSNVFRTLYEGEYVQFNRKQETDSKYNAQDVTGLRRKSLMCETKIGRKNKSDEDDDQDESNGHAVKDC